MDLIDIIESRRFLGGEFLTWLWYESAQRDGHFQIGDAEPFELHFDDQLVLEAFMAEAETSRLSGGAPSEGPEARTALRAGKRVSRAKLRISRGEREWGFTVTGADFQFSSVRVPSVEKDDNLRLWERIELIDELGEMWALAYRGFLDVRLRDSWNQVETEIDSWSQNES